MSLFTFFVCLSLFACKIGFSQETKIKSRATFVVKLIRFTNYGMLNAYGTTTLCVNSTSSRCKLVLKIGLWYSPTNTTVIKSLGQLSQNENAKVWMKQYRIGYHNDPNDFYVKLYRRPTYLKYQLDNYDMNKGQMYVWAEASIKRNYAHKGRFSAVERVELPLGSLNLTLPLEEIAPNDEQEQIPMVAKVKNEGNNPVHDQSIYERIELVIQPWVECAPNYYGCHCDKFCAETAQFRCNRYGERYCKIFWYNSNPDRMTCDKLCVPTDENGNPFMVFNGMSCNDKGEYICLKGYHKEFKNGAPQPKVNWCLKTTCETPGNKCAKDNKICVNVRFVNTRTGGFYYCRANYTTVKV